MKKKWLDEVEIPEQYLVSNEELSEEQKERYNIFKTELLKIFPQLSEEKIKEIYKEKFTNI